jgi:hypothetical protein
MIYYLNRDQSSWSKRWQSSYLKYISKTKTNLFYIDMNHRPFRVAEVVAALMLAVPQLYGIID